jgi:hypothetical protein
MKKKTKITEEQIKEWLDNQVTDIDTYDPISDMDEGEHIFGACMRVAALEEQNLIIAEIKRRLKL